MATTKKAAKKKAGRKNAVSKSPALEVERHWLNKREMADALGISVQAFDKWGVKPVAQRHQYGEAFFTVADVLANRLEKQAQRMARPELDLDAAEMMLEKEREELNWTRERAEGQRLKNAALRKELAPVAMIQWALSQAGSQISAVLGTLKGKVKRAQPRMSNEALHEIDQLAVEVQNIAAEIKLDWDDFDDADLSDPRVD